jgi:hypothetical protein
MKNKGEITVQYCIMIALSLPLSVGLYLFLWKDHQLVPHLVTIILGAVLGVWPERSRGIYEGVSALIGGIIGANVALTMHLICGYTMLDYFEDEGLGFVRSLLALSPFASVIGIVLAGLVWLIMWALFGHSQREMKEREHQPAP